MEAIARDQRFWDKLATKYAASPISDTAGYERTLARARDYLRPEHAALEIGCGTGTSAVQLAPSAGTYLATDISDNMLAIAREKARKAGPSNITFKQTAIGADAWPAGSFDVVFAFNVLHLVQDRAAALAGVRAALKPGGLFISKTPLLGEMNPLLRALVPLMKAVGAAPASIGFFDAKTLERDIAAAGFAIVANERHGSKKNEPRVFFVAQKA